MRDDKDFKLFEDVKLIGSPLFHSHYELDDGTGVYLFDFADHTEDFWNIVQGKYSKLSTKTKRKVLDYYKTHDKRVYVESYLEPKKYFPMYAQILNVALEHFQAVGELCDKPDLEREKLELGIKIMNIKDNPLNLQQ